MAGTLNFDAKSFDAKSTLTKVSDELRKEQQRAGIDGAASAVRVVEAAREAATRASTAALETARDDIKGVIASVNEALENPANLLPTGGLLAMCTAAFAAQVISVLKDIKRDGETLQTAFTKLASSAPATVHKLGGVLVKVTEGVTSSVQKMQALPDTFTAMSEKVREPSDFETLDVGSIKKQLDPSLWGTPLAELGGLKTELDAVVPELVGAITKLVAFAREAPGKIDAAAQPCGCSSAPTFGPLAALREQLFALQAVNLSPLEVAMAKVQELFSQLDVNTIKIPMDAFAKAALGLIGPVEEAQAAQKKARGLAGAAAGAASAAAGAASAVAGAAGGLKKLF